MKAGSPIYATTEYQLRCFLVTDPLSSFRPCIHGLSLLFKQLHRTNNVRVDCLHVITDTDTGATPNPIGRRWPIV